MDRWRQLRKHSVQLDAVSTPALTHCSKRQGQIALEQRDCFESLIRIQELREIEHDAQDLGQPSLRLVARTRGFGAADLLAGASLLTDPRWISRALASSSCLK